MIWGLTYISGHNASKISSCVTSRLACSTKYRSTSNAFGGNDSRSSPRQRQWFTVSNRNVSNTFIHLPCDLASFTEQIELQNTFSLRQDSGFSLSQKEARLWTRLPPKPMLLGEACVPGLLG